jgi:hypothetical protein
MKYERNWMAYKDELTQNAYSIDIQHTRGEKVYHEIATGFNKEDTTLIVTAINQCIEINPDNPQAVAQNILSMREALSGIFVILNTRTEQSIREMENEPWALRIKKVIKDIKAEVE